MTNQECINLGWDDDHGRLLHYSHLNNMRNLYTITRRDVLKACDLAAKLRRR